MRRPPPSAGAFGAAAGAGGEEGVEYILDVVVERKALSDLDNSIKDGRYAQQKWWLARCGLRLTVYLIEGKADDYAASGGGWGGGGGQGGGAEEGGVLGGRGGGTRRHVMEQGAGGLAGTEGEEEMVGEMAARGQGGDGWAMVA